MKILFLSHKFYPDIGGIEISSQMLAYSFANAGHIVHLLTWSKNPEVDDFPYTIIRNPNAKVLIEQHSWADIIFENNPCLRLSWPKLFVNRPSTVVLHTWINRLNGKSSLQDWLKLAWLKRAKHVVAVSNAIRARCWPRATVIENPYQENKFRILSPSLPRDGFVFLGRLVSDKGADLAVQAFHHLLTKTDYPNLAVGNRSMTIIGNGPELNYLKSLVSKLKLDDYVTFTGSLQDEALVQCLNRHRFLLVPSIWEEPFGMVALEGMACGCLPIVSNGGGLPDAIGNAGFTFERGNINALVSCICQVLTSPDSEKEVLIAASDHLAAHQLGVVSKKYLNLIESSFKD